MLISRRKQSILALVLVMVIVFSILSLAAYEPYFKLKMGLFPRMVCLSLYPGEGSFATLKIVREMQMQLAPSDEEYKTAGLTPDLLTGGTKAENGWDAVEEKEIVFGEIAKALVVSALEKLNEEEGLEQQHFDLYKWFVLGEEQEKEEIKEVEIFEEKEVDVIGGEDSYIPDIEKEKGE